jgi:two-component system, OmpR family, sensor histidine kinase KdpD
MEQVFSNLLSNSLKYSPPDTCVQISAWVTAPHKGSPHVGAPHVGGAQVVQVRVQNQGPAVPEEHLDRIFDKFYRLSASERVTGTGLGLSICKGIVEAHGGRIWAENLPDGFAFNFTLPLTWEGASPRMPVE